MNYKQAPDMVLWKCCQQDDMGAYNELFDRFVANLHRMGLRYVKNEQVVEELTTDILLNLWIRRHEIHITGQLTAYLFGVMHNKAISFLRKRVPVFVDIHALSDNILIADGMADQHLSFRDTQNDLEKSLSRLSPQRQKVFRLSREHDMSYAEIAREMNLSPNTVRNHMNAALEYLRTHCKDVTLSLAILLSVFRS